MACRYIYNGKSYTEYEILKLIKQGGLTVDTVAKAKQWLGEKLGLTEDQIESVAGLIDGKAFGKLESDAKILLSDEMSDGVERHEAFHRVFRFMLPASQRQALINEFRKRKNWQESLSEIKQLYPELSEDGQIEEYLADEFMYYSLADGNYSIPEPEIRGFFAKLLHFLKSLFTLSIKEVYQKINEGGYKQGIVRGYALPAYSKVKLPNSNLSTEQKQEMFEHLTYKFLDQVFKGHNIYQVIAGKFDENLHNIFSHLLVNGNNDGLLNKVATRDDVLAADLLNEIFERSPTGKSLQLKKESVFMKDFFKHLTTLGIKSRLEEYNENTIEYKEASENEDDLTKDYSFMKVAFEFDPKANMSKSMRLLLSSLDAGKPSPIFKLETGVPYGEASTILFNSLANLPANFDVFMEQLNSMSQPFVKNLIQRLQGNTNDYRVLKFRNEFIRTFAKNRYQFLIGMLRKGNIYSANALFDELSNKTIQDFKNNLIINNKTEEILLENLKSNDIHEIALALGLEGFDNLYNIELENGKTIGKKILELRSNVVESIKAGTPIQKLYDKHAQYKLNVKPIVKMLAEVLNTYKKPLDLMFYNAEGKKIYAISLNTYQSITLNTLNWIGKKQLALEQKLDLVREHIPHILNNETYRDGKIISAWLSSILNGNELRLSVFDGIKGQKEKSFKDLNETDLLAFYLNMPYEGTSLAIKHSDRSTVFAYQFANKAKIINSTDYDSMLTEAVDIALDYYENEKEYAENKESSTVKNFAKNKSKMQHFGFVKTNPQQDIRLFFETAIEKTLKYATEYGIFDIFKGSPVGIGSEQWKDFKSGVTDDYAIKSFVAHAYLNHFFNRIEEQKLFLGHLGIYKNLDDAYKRFAMQSGTGDILVTDTYNDAYINRVNRRDSLPLYNAITGALETINYVKPDGYFSELVLEESEQYSSDLLRDYNGESLLKHVFKVNIKKDLIAALGLTEAEAEKIADEKAAKYADKYTAMNENDGMSYANIFSWREFEHRNGIWTPEKENTFQLELAAMSLTDKSQLKDLTLYTNGRQVIAKQIEGFTAFKPFDVANIEQVLNVPNGLDWFNTMFESGNMLKPQYTGPVYQDPSNKPEDYIIGGRKTAYGILFPTMIIGTNLQKLNSAMISKGVDFVHFSSAAKYGFHDPKLILPNHPDISKRGLQFYTEAGEFNDEIFNQADILKTYLDIKYMKNQLSISNKPKTNIKNSTQSAKIIIGNIMQNGIPRDVKNATLFLNGSEEVKRSQSELYRIMQDYSSKLNSLIKGNMNTLLNELEAAKKGNSNAYAIGKFNNLIRILKESAESKNSAQTVLEAIDLFATDKTIELLSNKSKIENILFSIISNNVIRFERPGDAKPQFAVTGFETGTRGFNNSDLKFYEPVLDKDGNIIKVNPAEIMLPLPKKQIKTFLERFNTTNIVEAIEAYNNLSDEEKVIVKGLRIPNQQMSSNDIFRVKKFFVPTLESFVVVPSEIVIKAGADFDIDKLQIYFPSDNDNYNILLQLETELLLHPTNMHNLLAPVVDDMLKQDVLAKVVGELENGLSPQAAIEAAKSEELVSKSVLSDYTDIVKNIEKFKLYIETKSGVGQIAIVITTHSVAQVDNIELNNSTIIFEEDETVTLSTELPFEGMDNQYSLSLMYDPNAQNILETISMLLTSQVDGAKNPYPSRLNITNQTLNIITFLTRRGVPLETTITFLKQPLILEYLKRQRINESELIQNTKGSDRLKKSKKDLIQSLLGEDAYKSFIQLQGFVRAGGKKMNLATLEKGITQKQLINNDQLTALAHFINLIDITRNFRLFMTDMTPDTKTMKDMSAIERINENYEEFLNSGIIKDPYKHRNGLLKPFFEARDKYWQLYVDLYFTRKVPYKEDLKKLIKKFSKLQRKEEDKVKVMNEIENDLITYLIQNYHPAFKKYSFNDLFRGANSLPKQINAILKDPTHPHYDNYALRNLYLFFRQDNDIDNMRIYDRNLPTLGIDDMYDAILELPQDLQEKLVVYNTYQSGNSVGPFQLDTILPPSIKFNMVKEIVKTNPVIDLVKFEELFSLNNPKWLPSNKWQAKNNNFQYFAEYDDGGMTIYTVGDNKIALPSLGNNFSKIYNDSGKYVKPVKQVEQKVTTEPKKDVKQEIRQQVKQETTSQNPLDIFNQNEAKFKAAGISGIDFMTASPEEQQEYIDSVLGGKSTPVKRSAQDTQEVDIVDFYNQYNSKFKQFGITLMDWIDATIEVQQIIIKKCING